MLFISNKIAEYQRQRNSENFHKAAREGDVAYIKKVIAKDPTQASLCNEAGYQPIHTAAASKQAYVITALLEAKVDPNTKTADGETALLIATYVSCLPVMRALLQDPRARADIIHKEQTPLIFASINRYSNCMALLLTRSIKGQMRVVKETGKISSALLNALRVKDYKTAGLFLNALNWAGLPLNKRELKYIHNTMKPDARESFRKASKATYDGTFRERCEVLIAKFPTSFFDGKHLFPHLDQHIAQYAMPCIEDITDQLKPSDACHSPSP